MSENPPLPPILGAMQPRTSPRRLPRVLTLTPFFPSEHNDAGGCFVAEPIEELSKRSVVNTVVAVQPFYRAKVRARQSDTRTEWLRYFSLPGGIGLPSAGAFLFARVVAAMRELQKSGQVDLVHAHGALPCGHAAMLLNAELKLPYVVSVHGLDAFSTEQVSGRSGKWSRRVSQRVYANSKRVICISERVREQVLEGVGRGCRTSVVYNGVDPERFSPRVAPQDSLVVLAVGNLIPIKGHAVLIRAVASLAEEFPALELEIVGEGPEQDRLQTLAAKVLAGRVKFMGRQSRAQVVESMRRCTVFALPSRYEGLGCVYLEAMSCAKPVIGCRGQGIAEVIRHGSNGFLVGPENEKELSLALAMLLRDENLRRNLGRAARDTVVDRFTLAQQAESLERIYRESVA